MPAPRRLTRIVATLGPASERPHVVKRLIAAGMDVARLNLSHGDIAWHERMLRRVRAEARRAGRPVGILVDLQGPKVRLGTFDAPLLLRRGLILTLTPRASETDLAQRVLPVDYAHLPLEAAPGHVLLLADGAVRLRVEAVRGHHVVCRVLEGDALAPRAGLAMPEAKIVRSALTAKDRRDLAWAVAHEADFIALSFVRRPQDLQEARRLIDRAGGDALLIAKIETRQAVESLDEVLSAADGAMVARGDLGVELPPERVPLEQKRIIRLATAGGKPVITATQMLESMRHASRPTRAEASDVANAVLDGSWALMLSAETATGDYPIESVQMMDRITREAETLLLRPARRRHPHAALSVSEGIAEAAVALAFDIGARALVAFTRSGATARQVARALSSLPIFAYTPSARALTRMTLYRGIVPRRLGAQLTVSVAAPSIDRDLRKRREMARGDLVVILSGSPDSPQGQTNRLTVHRIE